MAALTIIVEKTLMDTSAEVSMDAALSASQVVSACWNPMHRSTTNHDSRRSKGATALCDEACLIR